MYFERESYLQQLISAEGNGMIKVITGIRRCGKSFLLFDIFKKHLLSRGVQEDHILQVNLEDRRNKRLRNPDNLLEYIDRQMVDKQMYYILLDEIQLVAEFEDVLNSYLHVANAEVYVTGSNAKFLSKDVITEFRGRGWEIRVRPLSFAEYYETVGGERAEALETYYLYGGLPGVAQMKTPVEKQNYLREIYETVYLRDVIGNTIAVTIADGKIASDAATDAAAFTLTVSNGALKGPNGKYIGQTSDANGLKTSDSAYTHTITFETSGDANVQSQGKAYLRYNATSGQTRFRYYKSSTYTAQKSIQLYKLVE